MFKHWNYRIIRHTPVSEAGFVSYAIHEVHYDEHGNPTAVSENPLRIVADSPEDLMADLRLMQEAASKPTLDYDSFNHHE